MQDNVTASIATTDGDPTTTTTTTTTTLSTTCVAVTTITTDTTSTCNGSLAACCVPVGGSAPTSCVDMSLGSSYCPTPGGAALPTPTAATIVGDVRVAAYNDCCSSDPPPSCQSYIADTDLLFVQTGSGLGNLYNVTPGQEYQIPAGGLPSSLNNAYSPGTGTVYVDGVEAGTTDQQTDDHNGVCSTC